MRGRIPFLSHADDVIRPVCVSLTAIGVIACAMAIQGWQMTSLALIGVIALIAGNLVFQVYRSVHYHRERSDAISQAARQAEEHYAEVLRRIVQYVEARDRYAVGHSNRVGALAEKIARQLDLSPRRAHLLRWAGELHDIGLLSVPGGILSEGGHIGVDGFRSIMQHSRIGYEILRPLQFLADVLPAIRHHHERMNGTGYPGELRGEKIPLDARILAVADAYEAMTHDRPHRPAMAPLAAMRELRRCTPAGYAEPCVRALENVVHLPDLEKAFARDARPQSVGQ